MKPISLACSVSPSVSSTKTAYYWIWVSSSMAAMPANSSLEGAPIVPTQPWNLSDSDPYTVQDGSVLPKTLALSTKIPTQQDTAATYSNSGATIESVVPYLTCRGTGPAQVFAGSRPSPQNPFQISCQETSVSGQPDAMEYSVSGSGTVRELLSPFTIPPDHYAMIYLDNMGQLKVVESLSIREHGTFFSSELREKFLGRLVLRNLGYHGVCSRYCPYCLVAQLTSLLNRTPTSFGHIQPSPGHVQLPPSQTPQGFCL